MYEHVKALLEMAEWLRANGEGHSTTPSPSFMKNVATMRGGINEHP